MVLDCIFLKSALKKNVMLPNILRVWFYQKYLQFFIYSNLLEKLFQTSGTNNFGLDTVGLAIYNKFTQFLIY